MFTGCATTQNTYVDSTTEKEDITLSLSYQDFQKASIEAATQMINSGRFNKSDGSPYVLAISEVINDTTQRLDVDQLIKKIRITLLNSGKFIITTAYRAGGAEDKMSEAVRNLSKNKNFNSKTVAKKGVMVAPDMGLSGKIIERVSTLTSGDKKVDYYFQLTITDLNTGLAWWEGETVVQKKGDEDSVNW